MEITTVERILEEDKNLNIVRDYYKLMWCIILMMKHLKSMFLAWWKMPKS